MNLLSWNAQGLGEVAEIGPTNAPDLVFLMETRLYGDKARRLHTPLGFYSGFSVDSVEWRVNFFLE